MITSIILLLSSTPTFPQEANNEAATSLLGVIADTRTLQRSSSQQLILALRIALSKQFVDKDRFRVRKLKDGISFYAPNILGISATQMLTDALYRLEKRQKLVTL